MTNKLPAPATNKQPKIKAREMSLEEFRSYLKGIMFVGGKNWVPSASQWAAIVQIIDQLQVPTATNQPTNAVGYPSHQVPYREYPQQPVWGSDPNVATYNPSYPVSTSLPPMTNGSQLGKQPQSDSAEDFPTFV